MMHHQEESQCIICDYGAGSQERCMHLTPLPYLFLLSSMRIHQESFWLKAGQSLGFPVLTGYQ